MKKYTDILLRIVFVIAMPFLMNAAYKQFFLEDDLHKHSEMLHLVRSLPKETEILYMGESSNITYNEKDTNLSSISSFMAGYFPSLGVYDITKPAAHSGVYKVLLEHIPETSKVKTVIVTLNLRSFGADWIHSELETSLQKELVLLRNRPALLNRFLLSFKGYSHKTKEERRRDCISHWKHDPLLFDYPAPFPNAKAWDGFVHHNGILNPDGSRNNELTETTCHFIKNYAFSIDTLHNPRIQDFDEIVLLAQKRGWNLVFNLLAENTERSEELVGKDLLYLMEKNRRLLLDYYTRKGVLVIDNMNSIPDSLFSDRGWPTEHYKEEGRRLIARNVAEAVKVFHPGDFVRYDKGTGRIQFYNNCEGIIWWDKMETLTKERAFEGEFSSRTDAQAPFGITFVWAMGNLPDNQRKYCHVDLEWSADTIPADDVQLVLELWGYTGAEARQAVPLKGKQGSRKDWRHMQHTFRLPASIPESAVIKVYVHNLSQNKVFIDDVRVRFSGQ